MQCHSCQLFISTEFFHDLLKILLLYWGGQSFFWETQFSVSKRDGEKNSVSENILKALYGLRNIVFVEKNNLKKTLTPKKTIPPPPASS